MDPSGSRVAVRAARLNDIESVERIEAASFVADRLSRRSLSHHIASETCDVLVAELNLDVVGYGLVFYRRTTRIARLYSIATAPEARGSGIARALIDACEAAGSRRGCSVLRLEVRIDNDAAIRLYRKLGYVQFGRHENYYEDGSPALRLEKPLGARSGVRAA
ncbi:MAG: N-acetyltransferase [Alphaproteobacteria bacterium]|nr:N-acetyltransferase [Alphaproteobacteria bacterium]